MPIMKKITPSLLIVCGGVWLGYLTFSNMMHAYYGWLPEFLGENRKPEWSEEELKVALVNLGTKGRDGVGMQIFPLLLVFLGGLLSGFQAIRANKQDTEQGSARQSTTAP